MAKLITFVPLAIDINPVERKPVALNSARLLRRERLSLSTNGTHLATLLSVRFGWRFHKGLLPLFDWYVEIARKRRLNIRRFKQSLTHLSQVWEPLIEACQLNQQVKERVKALLKAAKSDKCDGRTLRELARSQLLDPTQSHEKRDGNLPHAVVSFFELAMLYSAINVALGWSEDELKPTFCELCWRINMSSGKHCGIHRPAQYPKLGDRDRTKLPSARSIDGTDYYKSAIRRKPIFERKLRLVRRVDRAEFKRGDFKYAIESGTLREWLRTNRPRVYAEFAQRIRGIKVATQLHELVKVLDECHSDSDGERSARAYFHSAVLQDRVAIFDQLQRAEAWLAAASDQELSWGRPFERVHKAT